MTSTPISKPGNSGSNFKAFVEQFIKGADQEQTHTWFSPSRKTTVLHVPLDRREEFLERIYEYITTTREVILEDPRRGENSITEKIVVKHDNKFRMFADIDFGVDLFEKHELPSDIDVLKKYMSDLVGLYDDLIEDVFGIDFIHDRILAIRLPYKIHIIYPSVIVSTDRAKHIASVFIGRLKRDERFSKLIEHNEKIVDTCVYNTGLRLSGMHKSFMGMGKNNKGKLDHELRVHENLFGVDSYTHCYKFADPVTFEQIPFTLDLYKQSSILAHPGCVYTEPIKDDFFPAHASYKRANSKQVKLPKSLLGGGASLLPLPSSVLLRDMVDEGTGTGQPGGGKGQHSILVNSLSATIKYLVRQYNHLIDQEKIIYEQGQDDDGRLSGYLIFPLSTTECHFIGRPHNSQHQYLVVDKNGSRQKCHDCKDSGDHKPIRPGRFPNNVKDELYRLDVIRSDVIVKKQKKEVSEEQKMSAVDELIERVRAYYPKNELIVDRGKIVINEIGVHIGLQDLWCEVCKKSHDRPCTYLHATETGKMYLKCDVNPSFGLFYPNPPLIIDPTTRQFFFANCNVSFLSQNIIHNNYVDNTGDVSVDFEEEPIFEDENLNHLIYESLAATTWPIVKVIHHLGKQKFNCTRGGEWFSYKQHRWHANSESAINYFISETVAHYYRQVRDYYRENTESPELKQKRVTFIQKIIDKLTSNNSKVEILKEARTYFFEEDFYRTADGQDFETRLDERRNLLCFTNGVFDLDAGVFRDGDPYDFITLCVNYAFPEQSDPAKRALIKKFFVDMQPDEQEREYLLLFLSSLLHGMTNEEVFHIFTGAAANGKSLLRDLVMYTLGDYFESIPANLLTRERPSSSSPQPDIVKLKGKRAVFGSEPEAGQSINSGFMKSITGNDPIQGRLCHSNVIHEFKPHFKLVLLCNDIPVFDSNDDGTWRRSRIKEFPVVFMDNPRPNKPYEKLIDLTLKDKMQDSKEEFMLYLLEYFTKFKTRGKLQPTPKILQMVEKHKMKSNTVLQFVDGQTQEAPNCGILVADLYPRYVQWMRNELPGEHPLIKSKVIDELARMRTIEYSKYVRVKGRKGPQHGIKNRRFVEQDEQDEYEPNNESNNEPNNESNNEPNNESNNESNGDQVFENDLMKID